jgi:anti-sigma regulatory factor (Ser/Thr protein kinase)
VSPSGLALFEADARFHGERLRAYRAGRRRATPTTEKRLKELQQRSRLADGRLRSARAVAAQGARDVSSHATTSSPYLAPVRWVGTEAPVHLDDLRAELVLASDVYAPAAARRTVRAVCAGRAADSVSDAELAVSEVVTNAVVHAGGDGLSISFWSTGATLDVIVSDGGPGFVPRTRRVHTEGGGGRGLGLVDQLAEAWGSSICAPSSVWLRLAMPGA